MSNKKRGPSVSTESFEEPRRSLYEIGISSNGNFWVKYAKVIAKEKLRLLVFKAHKKSF